MPKYNVELSIPQIETIIDALHQQNYAIRCEVMSELSKQALAQKEYNNKLKEIFESSVSYQLESKLTELINTIYDIAL